MYDKVTAIGDFAYKTRQAATCPEALSFSVQHPTDSGTIGQVAGNKLGFSKLGWCWRSVEVYNRLPTSIRLESAKLQEKTQDLGRTQYQYLIYLNFKLKQKLTR